MHCEINNINTLIERASIVGLVEEVCQSGNHLELTMASNDNQPL